MAGSGAKTCRRERGTRGEPGHLPSQRFVHGLTLKKFGSEDGRGHKEEILFMFSFCLVL